MAAAPLSDAQERAKENRMKRKLIKIIHVESSQLPFRVTKERTGVILGSFNTKEEVDTFIDGYPLSQLQSKPTRRRAR